MPTFQSFNSLFSLLEERFSVPPAGGETEDGNWWCQMSLAYFRLYLMLAQRRATTAATHWPETFQPSANSPVSLVPRTISLPFVSVWAAKSERVGLMLGPWPVRMEKMCQTHPTFKDESDFQGLRVVFKAQSRVWCDSRAKAFIFVLKTHPCSSARFLCCRVGRAACVLFCY